MIADPATIRALQASPAAFRTALRLNDGRPWPLDPWQAEFFSATDPGWLRAIGREAPGGFSRAWSIRPRGHSKTHDIGAMIAWAIFAAPRARPVKGVVAAGDEDQARLVADAVRRIVRANDWLAGYVDVQRGRVVNPHTGSEATIISSDAPTSMGLLPDFIICDELTAWRSRDLWDSLFSAAAKQSHCFLAVLGNAGVIPSWQHELWESLSADPAWHCHRLPGAVASWISASALAEQERVLPPGVYRRLWQNDWAPEVGDALSTNGIDRAICDGHHAPGLPPGFVMPLAGLDIGLKHDKTALVILAIEHTDRPTIQVLHTRTWSAPPGGEVDLLDVEHGIYEACRLYRCGQLVADYWQAADVIQRLNRGGVISAMPIQPTAPALGDIAQEIVVGFREGLFRIPARETELIRDLRRLSILQRPAQGNTSYRLIAPRDSTGHCDLASAFMLAGSVAAKDARRLPPPRRGGSYSDDYPSVNGIPAGGVPVPQGYANDYGAMGYRPDTARQIPLPPRR